MFILLLSKATFSQNAVTDSLRNELLLHAEDDTIKVNILYSLAFNNFQRDLKLTKSYLEKAEHLSNKLNYTKGKGKVFYLKGILESIKSNYPKSIELFNRSMEHYKAIDYKQGIAAVYSAFGNIHTELSEYQEAIADYERAEEIYMDELQSQLVINVKVGTANAYLGLGRYEEAIAQYKEAKKLSEKSNLRGSIAIVNANIGIVYADQGNFPLAIEYYNKALEYYKEEHDTLSIARSLGNLGVVYGYSDKLDKALEFHFLSLKFSSKVGDRNLESSTYCNVGNVYIKLKDFNTALKYFNQSLRISEEIGDSEQMAVNLLNIGRIYLQLKDPILARQYFLEAKELNAEIGSKRILSYNDFGLAQSYFDEKEYGMAMPLALEVRKYALELEILELHSMVEELLYKIYNETGNYKKALESHQKYKQLNDSLFNKENIEKIAQIEYEYKYKKALDSASIRELNLTNTVNQTTHELKKSRQNLFIGIIVFLLVTILLGGIINYLKIRNIKSQTQNIIMEQKLLRSQMTPHFIFNSLSVLQGMILNKEEKRSVSYLSKFSKLLRITLENSRQKTVYLQKELTAIEDYLFLQSIENKSYKYTIEIDDSVERNKFQIPPMLIQPFIENAIEHAFVNQSESKRIDIRLSYVNEDLICTIIDNGIGVNNQVKVKGNGKQSLSTTITSERLEILSKDFKKKGYVLVEDREKYNEQGTIVTLVIPYEK